MPPLRQRMPVRSELADEDGLISRPWRMFLRGQSDTLNITAQRVGSVVLTGQNASIAATPVPMVVNAGLYRVSVYARRVQAATTSSDLAIDVGWTESAQPLTLGTGTNSVNTVSAVLAGTWLIRVDATSTITYTVTYASVGATPMLYRLDVTVEQVRV